MATMADMCGDAPTIDMYPNMFDQDAVGTLCNPQHCILGAHGRESVCEQSDVIFRVESEIG